MANLGMELHGVHLALRVLNHRNRVFCAPGDAKAGRDFSHVVAVAVPHPQRRFQPGEELAIGIKFQLREPVLAARRRLHPAPQLGRHELQAVANPKYRNFEFEEALVTLWGGRIVNRGRTAGKNESLRPQAQQLRVGDLTGHNDRVNLQFADAARDELRVLRAEVKNYDGVDDSVTHVIRWSAHRVMGSIASAYIGHAGDEQQ